jgi:plasmid maintenance system antidote protein VapI
MPLSKTGAAFWMNIQARFDLETAEDVLAPQIKKIVAWCGQLSCGSATRTRTP